MSADLWPYLVVVLAGFLPNEMFRMAAVLLSRGVDEQSELFGWIRVMATTLLAAVVSRLVYAPAAVLDPVPIAVRVGAIAVGVLSYFALRRSLLLGILAGEACLICASWWFGQA